MTKQELINELIRGMQMTLDDWTAYTNDVRASIERYIVDTSDHPGDLSRAARNANFTVVRIQNQPMRYW